jgi:hypothetical protein
LHDVVIPSIQEIAVISVSRVISTSKHKRIVTVLFRESGDGEENFVENSRKSNWVSRRTVSVVDSFDGVGHVRLVVGAVKIFAVPTHWEPNLSAKTVDASANILGEGWRFRVGHATKTSKAYGLVPHRSSVVRTT